jgi:hypothetical protein
LRLRQRDHGAGLFAGQDFLTFEVTPIRNDVQVIPVQRGFRRLSIGSQI